MTDPQLARSRRWIFARHARPVSAWSRWATTPLLLVPLWTRRAATVLPIAAWFAVNPVVTPPVTDDDSFATRAVLGEEQWASDQNKRGDLVALNLVGSACPDRGWRVARRDEHRIRLEIPSTVMSLRLVLTTEDERVTLTTCVRYAAPRCKVAWKMIEPLHGFGNPRLLAGAARKERDRELDHSSSDGVVLMPQP